MYLTRKDWTIKNAPFAIEAAKGSGIFPETLLAMAIVESQGAYKGVYYPGAGLVARKANNYFGIKHSTVLATITSTIHLATHLHHTIHRPRTPPC